MRKTNRVAWMLAAAIGALAVGQVPAAEGEKKDSLVIEGSNTCAPIIDAYAEHLKKAHPNTKITAKSPGSGVGITSLIEGRCDIAPSSRFMKGDEFKKAVEKGVTPVAHAFAMDGICIAVHPSNPQVGLTVAQVRDIYNGKIKNWKDVGGPDLAIVVLSRDTASGTYEAFHELVMKKEKFADGVQLLGSTKEIHDRVATTKGAIGYVGLGYLDDKVKALSIDGVTPSRKTIVSGKYPIARPLFLFTNGYPALGSLVHEVVTLHLTEKGQKLIETAGYVAVTEY